MPLPKILENILGSGAAKITDSIGNILDDVITNKEELAEIKLKIDQEINRHTEAMEAQAQSAFEAEVKDRESARSREVEIVKAGGKNLTQHILAFVGVFGFFGVVAYILAKGLGSMNTETSFIVGNMTGLVGAIAKDIFGYFFGSSKSSKEKDRAISSMAGAVKK